MMIFDGADGFVSIEVNTKLANNARGMIDEGRRYFQALNRPNVMIKNPGDRGWLPCDQGFDK